MAERGEKMPVCIVVGADPASVYSASAPLPPAIDEFIFAGFLRKVGHLVQLNSQVQAIRVKPKGVDVTYRRDGEMVTTSADYCLTCIPMHLLAGIDHNFPNGGDLRAPSSMTRVTNTIRNAIATHPKRRY